MLTRYWKTKACDEDYEGARKSHFNLFSRRGKDGKEADGFTWAWELLTLPFLLSADTCPGPHCPASLPDSLPFKQLSSQWAITGWKHCILRCRRSHQEHGRPRVMPLLHSISTGTNQNSSPEGERDPLREKSGYVRAMWKVKSWVSWHEPGQLFLLSSLVIALLTSFLTSVIISTLNLQNLSPKGRMREKVSTESFRFDESFFYDEKLFCHKIPG